MLRSTASWAPSFSSASWFQALLLLLFFIIVLLLLLLLLLLAALRCRLAAAIWGAPHILIHRPSI